MKYKEDLVYQELEKMILDAGVDIMYCPVPEDSIDGAIWARADREGMSIIMPDDDEAFPSEEKACLILGHEMGHILSDADSPDNPVERTKNEALCDLIGVYLYKLAEMRAGYKLEKKTFGV